MVRNKNRYVVVKVVAENQRKICVYKGHLLASSILEAVGKYYGQFGTGTVEHVFSISYWNESTQLGIIRCSRQYFKYITSILPLITLIGDSRAKFQIIGTGATIRQCKKYILKLQLLRLHGHVEYQGKAK